MERVVSSVPSPSWPLKRSNGASRNTQVHKPTSTGLLLKTRSRCHEGIPYPTETPGTVSCLWGRWRTVHCKKGTPRNLNVFVPHSQKKTTLGTEEIKPPKLPKMVLGSLHEHPTTLPSLEDPFPWGQNTTRYLTTFGDRTSKRRTVKKKRRLLCWYKYWYKCEEFPFVRVFFEGILRIDPLEDLQMYKSSPSTRKYLGPTK